jgi:hypothetical protein
MRVTDGFAIRAAASFTALLLTGGAVAFGESVILLGPIGGTWPAPPEYGVLLFGRSAVHIFGPGPTPIDIGSPDSRLTSLVAFGAGFPPAIGTRTLGGGTTLTFIPPVVVPLKIWAICANASCDGPFSDQLKATMEAFLFKANQLLDRERTGLVLAKAGPADGSGWISDQTNNAAKRDQFKNFTTAEGNDDCTQERLDLLTNQMKDAGAFNMYLVGRVDGEAGRGESCLEPDIAVVGAAAAWHTRLHEIGHNLGLLHVDGRQIRRYVPSQNLMYKASADRRFLSEGQTFLIYFDIQTALKRVFSSLLPAQWPFRDCTNPQAECPPLTTWVWDDQD